MDDSSVREPDMLNRLAVGRMDRELFNEFLDHGKPERAMGLVQFCDRMGVTIPDGAPMLKLVRDGKY